MHYRLPQDNGKLIVKLFSLNPLFKDFRPKIRRFFVFSYPAGMLSLMQVRVPGVGFPASPQN